MRRIALLGLLLLTSCPNKGIPPSPPPHPVVPPVVPPAPPPLPPPPPPDPPAEIWAILTVLSIQHTAAVCFDFLLPDSLHGRALSLDSLTCPHSAWFPGRIEFIGRDSLGTERTCFLSPLSGYGWPWPKPPKDGKASCLWQRLS